MIETDHTPQANDTLYIIIFNRQECVLHYQILIESTNPKGLMKSDQKGDLNVVIVQVASI